MTHTDPGLHRERRSPLYIVLASSLTTMTVHSHPLLMTVVPGPSRRAVPSARCGPAPPIQPRSNRSTPCGRRRVAASTVLRPCGLSSRRKIQATLSVYQRGASCPWEAARRRAVKQSPIKAVSYESSLLSNLQSESHLLSLGALILDVHTQSRIPTT